MKKVIALMLISVLTLLVSCGSKGQETEKETQDKTKIEQNSQTENNNTADEPAPAIEEATPIKQDNADANNEASPVEETNEAKTQENTAEKQNNDEKAEKNEENKNSDVETSK